MLPRRIEVTGTCIEHKRHRGGWLHPNGTVGERIHTQDESMVAGLNIIADVAIFNR